LSPLLFCLALFVAAAPCRADDALAQAIARVKPSVVGVGSLQKLRTPPMNFIGTGFVAGDGLSVLTCAPV
ncbi:MAG: serine protease, partial [Janthinobacterium sp.]